MSASPFRRDPAPDGGSGLDAAGHEPTERRERELATLALLRWPAITTVRMRSLVEGFGAEAALDALHRGDTAMLTAVLKPDVVAALLNDRPSVEALDALAEADLRSMTRSSIGLWLPGDAAWSDHFGVHAQRPVALFTRGDRAALLRPRVAIVGTRSASPAGREMARMLGHELSEAGVAIVSGLAFGVDAHAHAGALASSDPNPVGVVGSGLDVVYPLANRALWERVGSTGLMLSEYLPSARPSVHTFPARNRIIAALAQVVVVVESSDHGGSLLTADAAHQWQRPVMVVPGNPLQPSCAGSNRLLRERLGERPVQVCLETADVLAMLMLERATDPTATDARRAPSPSAALVLGALGWERATTARLVTLTGLRPGDVAASLHELEASGWVEHRNGDWHQRAGTQQRSERRRPGGDRTRGSGSVDV